MATTKKVTKKTKTKKSFPTLSTIILSIMFIITLTTGLVVKFSIDNGKIEATIDYSETSIPAYISDDKGELIETTEYEGEEIKTVEEVDGGMFEDIDTGLSSTEGEYEDLGWAETYNVSSPEAFMKDTYGKCIIANNKYGAQCVSLARVFWWSYANRDVSTCGTGMAKGMMNCAEQNAGDDFLVFWGSNGVQAGDWLVFDGGQFGHVGMALGEVKNGYVTLLGENQGGHTCGQNVGGSATNIVNISVKNVIGYYRPKAYIKPQPQPKPTPTPEEKCKTWDVKKGDTLGKIMKECEGKIEWNKINEYASKWYSTKTKKDQSVFAGWTSVTGVGLFSGDVIEFRK